MGAAADVDALPGLIFAGSDYMISLLRFLGRRLLSRTVVRNRWIRRALFVLAVVRWLVQRTDRSYDLKINPDEYVDIIVTKQETVR